MWLSVAPHFDITYEHISYSVHVVKSLVLFNPHSACVRVTVLSVCLSVIFLSLEFEKLVILQQSDGEVKASFPQ